MPIVVQLDRAARGAASDGWPNKDEPFVCHGICAPGKSLVDDLKEIDSFVTAHPTEVVTLLTESDTVTTDDIAQAYEASGILPNVLKSLAPGATWPTLSDPIRRGERVVVFHVDQSKAGGTSYDWMLPRWSWTWETPWDNEKLADFARCDADRGAEGNAIYVVDTYLEDVQAAPASHSALVNYDPFLIDRVTWCQKSKATLPNFVMVNFCEVGDVDVLNGLAPAPAGAGDAPPSAYDVVDAGAADGATD